MKPVSSLTSLLVCSQIINDCASNGFADVGAHLRRIWAEIQEFVNFRHIYEFNLHEAATGFVPKIGLI